MPNRPQTKRHAIPTGQDLTNAFSQTERTLFVGVILDVIQYMHTYEIGLEYGLPMRGVALDHSPMGYVGYRPHHMYMPGTQVICYKPNNLTYCYILGAAPVKVGSLKLNQPDWIHQNSGVGITDDVVHKAMLDYNFELPNYNAHRPYDTFPGEVGWTNPLGLGLNLGLSSIMLRAGDVTGLWLFYLNQCARLAAHRYQFWNAGIEIDAGENLGENFSVEFSSPYPWEMKGVATPSADFVTAPFGNPPPSTESGDDPLWKTDQQQATFEPKYPDQQLIPRMTTIGGYIGDLQRSIVSCPPSTLDVERYELKTNHIGLSELYRGSNGIIEIRSRKGIVLEKSAFIAVPKQLTTPDDPTGDTTENYKAAGYYGDSEEHDRAEFEGNGPIYNAAQLFDRFAWTRNRLGMQALNKHTKDWHVSKETLTEGFTESIDKAIFAPHSNAFRAPFPQLTEVLLDHRPNSKVKLYKSRSTIAMNDDGSVLIEDGWGSQISMSNGNITLSCSGDVIVANGRNFTVLAPNDINLRAGNCADLSAGTGDLRLKADKNLHMLAGNSGRGGALIESRGTGFSQDFVAKYGTDVVSSGIILKATNGTCGVYGNSVYIRSIKNGSITIDGDSGKGDVNLYCSRKLEMIGLNSTSLFNTTPARNVPPQAALYMDGSQISSSHRGRFFINAPLLSNSQASFKNTLTALAVATNSGGPTGQLRIDTRNQINSEIASSATLMDGLDNNIEHPFKAGQPYDPNNGAGLDSVIDNLGFTFRSDEQYGLNYKDDNGNSFLIEARWQQMYRLTGVDALKWVEPIVKSPDGDKKTLPYPGWDNWTNQQLFATVDLRYWDVKTGDEPDVAKYTDVKGKQIELNTCEKGYLINKS